MTELTNDIDLSRMADGEGGAGTSQRDADIGDFFEQLDAHVNGLVQDNPGTATQHRADPEPRQRKPEVPHRDPNVDPKLEQRYSDSSAEAKRLKARLDELSPYAPSLDELRRDEKLFGMVQSYLKGEAEPSALLQDKLDLPEDFIFSGEEAMTDPNSDSGKALSKYVDMIVRSRVTEATQQSSRAAAAANEIAEFKRRHEMDDEQFADLKEFADTHRLSWDDVALLRNREKREKEIATKARDDVHEQRRVMSDTPASLASKSSAASVPDKSAEDIIFDALFSVDNGVDDLLSLEG